MPDPYTAHGGTLTRMLLELRKIDPKKAESLETSIQLTFASEDGAKVLDFLDKSVLLSQPPLGVDDRALREIHGQRHLVAELKRLSS